MLWLIKAENDGKPAFDLSGTSEGGHVFAE